MMDSGLLAYACELDRLVEQVNSGVSMDDLNSWLSLGPAELEYIRQRTDVNYEDLEYFI